LAEACSAVASESKPGGLTEKPVGAGAGAEIPEGGGVDEILGGARRGEGAMREKRSEEAIDDPIWTPPVALTPATCTWTPSVAGTPLHPA